MWKDKVRKVVPYVPGEQPNFERMIKLNTNENPYPPSERVQKLAENLTMDKLRLYPDPKAEILVDALAKTYGRRPEEIFVGVGSDDVLAMSFLTFFNGEEPVLFPDITYSFYDVWADLYRIPYKRPALDENFCIRPEDYYGANGGIVIANPNAPTSIYMGLYAIEEIVKHNPDVVVIVDEAYIDFGGESALPLIDKYENLLVVQTFSKSRSMAGMRIGYAMGNPELIKALNDVKYSFNSYTMNYPSILLGTEQLKDTEYFKTIVDKVVKTRENAKESLQKLGFHCLDSKTNFLFVTHECIPAKQIFETLRSKNIFVRYFDKPRIDNYLRISIGTDEEMNELITELKKIVNG